MNVSRLAWTVAAIGMLVIAAPTRAQNPAPPSPSQAIKPPGVRLNLAPAIVDQLKQVTSAWIYEVDSLPSPRCTPRAYALDDTILCHPVRSATAAPGKLWISDMTSSLWRSSAGPVERPFSADVGVRLLAGSRVTDVLVSVEDGRILLGTMESATLEIVPEDSFSQILRILRRALPRNQAIENAIEVAEAKRSTGHGYGTPLWPDCAPGPEEGVFVYYEEEPVPLQTPQPQLPPDVKPDRLIKVTLHVFVDRSGRVCAAKAIQGLEPYTFAAIEAAKHWVFKPATSNGKPLGVWVELPFSFKP